MSPPDKLTVMLVDDDRDVLSALGSSLVPLGYEVHAFTSANEAVMFVARESPTSVQYAFVDYYLRPAVASEQDAERMNGIDATKELLRIAPHLRVVLFSANEQLQDKEEARREGACRVIVKRPGTQKGEVIDRLIRELRELEELARQAELDRDQRGRIAATVESLAVGMLLIDREGVAWGCNRQWREIEEMVDPSEFPLHRLGDSFNKESGRRELFQKAVAGNKAESLTCAVRGGQFKYLHLWARPVTNPRGDVVACSVSAVDATGASEVTRLQIEHRVGIILDAILDSGYQRARAYAMRGDELVGIAERGGRLALTEGFHGYAIDWKEQNYARHLKSGLPWIQPFDSKDHSRDALGVVSSVACLPLVCPEPGRGIGETDSPARIVGVLAVDQHEKDAETPITEADLGKLTLYASEIEKALCGQRREGTDGLAQVKAAIAMCATPVEALRVICRAAVELTGCVAAHIRVKEGDEAALVAWAGQLAPHLPERLQAPPAKSPVFGQRFSLSVRVLQSGRPMIMNRPEKLELLDDPSADSDDAEYRELHSKLNCFATYPMTLTNTVGVLAAQAEAFDHFKPSDRRAVLAALANSAAMAWLDVTRARDRQAAETQRDMAFSTVHNLRQPATGLRFALEEGKEDAAAGKLTLKEAGAIITRALSYLDELEIIITGVHRFLKPLELRKSWVNLRDVIDSAAKPFTDHAWADVKCDVADNLKLQVDRESIKEVISELIQNAAHHLESSKKKGRITVISRAEESPHPGDEKLVRVEIEDDGPGVPARVERTLFDQGITTRPTGTGLGLAFVKKIIEGHGGRVWHERPRDGGARFVIILSSH